MEAMLIGDAMRLISSFRVEFVDSFVKQGLGDIDAAVECLRDFESEVLNAGSNPEAVSPNIGTAA